MKGTILNYEDLSECREILESRQPPFVSLLIYFLCLFLVAIYLWLWFGEVDIAVKADGIVRTVNNVSLVCNIDAGIVERINFHEGRHVKKGDLLYVVTDGLDRIEADNFTAKKQKILAEITLLEKMGTGILTKKNQFHLNQSTLENEYFNRFETFFNKYEQLRLEVEKAQYELTNGQKLGVDVLSQKDLDQLERDSKMALLELNRYQNETVFNAKTELQTMKEQLQQIDDQLKSLAEKQRRNQIRAPITGMVQVIKVFNRGDFLTEETEVLRIVPGKQSHLKMDLSIANKDIGLIKTDQLVKYRFPALPFQEYGVLVGKVRVISGNISEHNNTAYHVEGTVAKNRLYDKKGIPSEIKVGMLCEARIVVKRKRLINVILEKLDFQ